MSKTGKESNIVVKEKITEEDYGLKLVSCSNSAATTGAIAITTVSLAVPFILKRLRFLRTTFELRIAAGLCSGVAAAYYFGKDARRRCIERVENNYKY